MHIKRRKQRNLSRIIDKKFSFEDIPQKTMRVTLHALRWVFFLIFIFIIIGILVLILSGGENYVQIILGYSITGFFTFFMGYFGWILAQGVIEILSGKNESPIKGFSYYHHKHKKHKF